MTLARTRLPAAGAPARPNGNRRATMLFDEHLWSLGTGRMSFAPWARPREVHGARARRARERARRRRRTRLRRRGCRWRGGPSLPWWDVTAPVGARSALGGVLPRRRYAQLQPIMWYGRYSDRNARFVALHPILGEALHGVVGRRLEGHVDAPAQVALSSLPLRMRLEATRPFRGGRGCRRRTGPRGRLRQVVLDSPAGRSAPRPAG